MINFSIIIKSNHWPRRLFKVKKIFNKIIKHKKLFKFKREVIYYCNLVLLNDSLIKKYNKIYKNDNKSTDVLTFISNVKKKCVNETYCDIMISAETLNKDAKQDNKNFYDHLTHLIVHSFLHINGFQHKQKSDFLIMKSKEIKILKKLGISNPY